MLEDWVTPEQVMQVAEQKEFIKRFVMEKARAIQSMPVTEEERAYRIECLNYAVQALRKASYEEDKPRVQKWGRILREMGKIETEFRKVFDLEFEKIAVTEAQYLKFFVQEVSGKITRSFKVSQQNKDSDLRAVEYYYTNAVVCLDHQSMNGFQRAVDKIAKLVKKYQE